MGSNPSPHDDGASALSAPSCSMIFSRPLYFFRMICTIDFSVWKLVAASKLSEWRLDTPLVNVVGNLISLQRVHRWTPTPPAPGCSETTTTPETLTLAAKTNLGQRRVTPDAGASGWRLHLDCEIFGTSKKSITASVEPSEESAPCSVIRLSPSPASSFQGDEVGKIRSCESLSSTSVSLPFATVSQNSQFKTTNGSGSAASSSAGAHLSSDFCIRGLFLNTNTAQQFRSLNRRQYIEQVMVPLLQMLEETLTRLQLPTAHWNSLATYSTVETHPTSCCSSPGSGRNKNDLLDVFLPQLLSCNTRFDNLISLSSRFLLVCFADLKNHLYYYNVATPVLRPTIEFRVIRPSLSMSDSSTLHRCACNPCGSHYCNYTSRQHEGDEAIRISSDAVVENDRGSLPLNLTRNELAGLGEVLLVGSADADRPRMGCLGACVLLKYNRQKPIDFADGTDTRASSSSSSLTNTGDDHDDHQWLIEVFVPLTQEIDRVTQQQTPSPEAFAHSCTHEEDTIKLGLTGRCCRIFRRLGIRWLSTNACVVPLWSFFVLLHARLRTSPADVPSHSDDKPQSETMNTVISPQDAKDLSEPHCFSHSTCNILLRAIGCGKTEWPLSAHGPSTLCPIAAAVCCVDTGSQDVLGWPMRSVLFSLGYLGLCDGILPLLAYRDGLQGPQLFRGTRDTVSFSQLLYIWMPPKTAFILREPPSKGDPSLAPPNITTRSARVTDGWLRCVAPDPVGNKQDRRGSAPGAAPGITFTVDLRRHLDPTVSQADAVNLNIQLIRWRILPSFDATRLQKLRFLLIGMGTLGCAIARTLVGWGVTHMSLMDSGRVALSSPVRQGLYIHEDATWGASRGKLKVVAAKERLHEIRPDLCLNAIPLEVPTPGHPRFLVPSATHNLEQVLHFLERLIDGHDIVLLLTDSRESRWLPSLLVSSRDFRENGNLSQNASSINLLASDDVAAGSARTAELPGFQEEGQHTIQQIFSGCSRSLFQTPPTFRRPVCITVALGFDSFVVMRHGHRYGDKPTSQTTGSNQPLACYFCNDLAAPADSIAHRPLDEQCTVTRPGVSGIAASVATELIAALSQHPLAPDPPHSSVDYGPPTQRGLGTPASSSNVSRSPEKPSAATESCLGVVPHTIRGSLGTFQLSCTQTEAFEHCICCSEPVCKMYCSKDKMRFIEAAIRSSESLEQLSGLAQLKQCCREAEVLCFDTVDSATPDDDFTFC